LYRCPTSLHCVAVLAMSNHGIGLTFNTVHVRILCANIENSQPDNSRSVGIRQRALLS
jgi:hypothetical protein